MAIGSGLGGQVGFINESTYGTGVTVTKFAEVESASITKTKNAVQGGGLAAGRMVQDGSRRVVTSTAAEGEVKMEVTTKGMGLWLNHLFGGTVTPVQQAATTAYLQTHSLTDNYGKSLTIQTGVPDRTGTVRPYTATGCKITSAEFSCGMNELLTASFNIDAQGVTEATAIATASYTTGQKPFHAGLLAVKTGTFGSESVITGVKGISLSIERPQQTDAYYASATPGTKSEPVMNDWVKISGSLEMDFVDKTQVADLFSSDTATSLVIEFVGATIASTYKETIRFKIPKAFFDEGAPKLEGPDVVGLDVSFVGQLDTTNGSIICEYISTDTTL